MLKRITYLIVLSFLFLGCARSYHTINPNTYGFSNRKSLMEDVDIYYAYDMQRRADNKPATRKESRRGVRLISVKIINNSDRLITLDKNRFSVYTGIDMRVPVVDIPTYMRATRQNVESFVFWYGIAGVGYQQESTSGPSGTSSSSTFTFSPFPLIIGVLNAIVAGTSNQNQLRNLKAEDIFSKTIAPHSSITGLLPIQVQYFPELNFSYPEYAIE